MVCRGQGRKLLWSQEACPKPKLKRRQPPGSLLGPGVSRQSKGFPVRSQLGSNPTSATSCVILGPGLEPQGRARPVGEEKQMTQELTGHIASVQAEEAGLRWEKARLHSETQQLRQRLQMLPGVHVDHLTQLQEKWCKEEASCSELERKLAAARGQTTSTQQIRGVYQEVAEAQGQHWRKTVPTSRRRSSLWRREPRRAGWGPRGWRESPRSSGKTTSATGRRCRSRVTPSPSDGALVLC
ncbi:uncharacterized protein LOC106729546 isoform X2 [Camelus ferus]|uniref:Uncharacterized protein LOC106729546 isoform X2 n=1 Tax=Camelus ferus TaxID=419612 RepID=A0A8B8TUJ2_CAMFR|nr:uncharacterized protein LOC106729546 isoform X2 [Camelus ferus]